MHSSLSSSTARRRWLAAGTLAIALAAGAGTAAAQSTLDTRLVASGLSQPLFAVAPFGDNRVFVVEKAGTIKIVGNGSVSTFLSISVATASEQGLLGLAFDPGFNDKRSPGYRRFFVDYIDAANGDTVIASYKARGLPLRADPATRVEVLRIDQPNGLTNHKGGWIGFKPGDANHLYIATGDGGSGNDPFNNAQNKGVLLGKMLRIDINRDDFPDPNVNYAIPADNPFVGDPAARGEIFAYGLRNPFRNSFDRTTGNLWIADVGQDAREELDYVAAASTGGQNFGWRVREGDIATPGITDPPLAGATEPLLVYDHGVGESITGGYVVRDPRSALDGRYVFADFITGKVWAIVADGLPKTLADATDLTATLDAGAGGALGNIASFGEGTNGALYIVDFSAGKVVQVVTRKRP